MTPTLTNVVRRVEGSRGVHFVPQEIEDAMLTTERKCSLKGKDASYYPLLLEDELHGIVTRQGINSIGGFC